MTGCDDHDRKISDSPATVEFKPQRKGTRFVLTEQGAYLDGWDKPSDRARGTLALMDALEASLRDATLSAKA